MADDTGSTAQSEAQRMLDAFASVGVTQFDIAHTNIDQEKRGYRKEQTLRQTKTSMPYLLDSAPRRENNVILRPHHPPAVVLIQLDDLKQEQLEHVRAAVRSSSRRALSIWRCACSCCRWSISGRASAALIAQTVASTVSRPSCWSAAMRLWPSITR